MLVASAETPERQAWTGESAAQSLLEEANARIRQAVVVAALQFLAKHAFNFRVYEAVIERARRELVLPFVAMSELVGSATPGSKDELEQRRLDFHSAVLQPSLSSFQFWSHRARADETG